VQRRDLRPATAGVPEIVTGWYYGSHLWIDKATRAMVKCTHGQLLIDRVLIDPSFERLISMVAVISFGEAPKAKIAPLLRQMRFSRTARCDGDRDWKQNLPLHQSFALPAIDDHRPGCDVVSS
jgi:hypothetical protein